jgi:glycosyltransferase involved in cell wall biosynthesis
VALVAPDISVVIPAYNEGARLVATIHSIADTRTGGAHVEVVIADDASGDSPTAHLGAAWPELTQHPQLDVVLTSALERAGVPRSRNLAARVATGDVLFITDAHVRFPVGWDEMIARHLASDRILAGAVEEANTPFVGYGCRLVVPFMGTYWNRERPDDSTPVQIAACPATVITRDLFERLGGYDEGMIMYGAAEPEFSVRAWLSGAEVVAVPDLKVEHLFKLRDERAEFIRTMRLPMVCNALRFGLLYTSEEGSLQLLRYYALKFPNFFQEALSIVEESDVWLRRAQLEQELDHPFSWFVERFGIRDQAGGDIV